MTDDRFVVLWRGRQVEKLDRLEMLAALHELIPMCIDLQKKVYGQENANMHDFFEAHDPKNTA